MTAAADINVFFIELLREQWNGGTDDNGILGMPADRLSRISPESRVCAGATAPAAQVPVRRTGAAAASLRNVHSAAAAGLVWRATSGRSR